MTKVDRQASLQKFAVSCWHELKRLRHIYLAGVIIYLIVWRAFFSPDFLFLLFLPVFILYGHGREYIKRFVPFVVLLFSYESLRSLIPYINKHVHYTLMPNFDRWLFHGTLPTVWLQQHWYHGSLHWYDYYFYFVYMLHFLTPFILALVLWKFRPAAYWRYITALLGLSFAGFATYIAFPAAPPWLASDMHIIPAITKLSTAIWWGWGVHNIPTLYNHLNPNPVAAVPSLHAAYPTLDWLFVNRLFSRRISIPFLIYPFSIFLGVVYLGEHYVFDVLLGVVYAVVIFFAAEYLSVRLSRRNWAEGITPAVSGGKAAMPVSALTNRPGK